MREKLKTIVPAPLWQGLKFVATALHLREPHVMLTPQDIAMLEKWGRDRKSLVEIGVFEGGSALVLRRVMHSEGTLMLIDPFVPDSISGMRGSYRISRLIAHRCQRGRVRYARDFSFHVAKTWNTPLDFLFIDGDHSEQSTRQDFEDWERFVEPHGVILFHDARLSQPSEQPWMGAEGSTAVVDKLFRHQQHPRWKIVDEGGSVVALQRR